MKREKIYCLLSALVISIFFMILTLKFTSINVEAILLYFVYLTLIFTILVSILEFIKNKESKANQYGLLSTIDAFIAILSFIFALHGIMQSIKNITHIIFVFAFLALPFFCGLWIKYEKIEK